MKIWNVLVLVLLVVIITVGATMRSENKTISATTFKLVDKNGKTRGIWRAVDPNRTILMFSGGNRKLGTSTTALLDVGTESAELFGGCVDEGNASNASFFRIRASKESGALYLRGGTNEAMMFCPTEGAIGSTLSFRESKKPTMLLPHQLKFLRGKETQDLEAAYEEYLYKSLKRWDELDQLLHQYYKNILEEEIER